MKRAQPSYFHARENSVDRRMRPCPNSRTNLEAMYSDESDQDTSHETVESDHQPPARDETISVFLRLRPYQNLGKPPCAFKIQDNTLIAKCVDETGSSNKDLTEKHYTFSQVFDDLESQVAIFERCIRPNLSDIFNDSGATFLTYGTSGSGKTYTLLGSNDEPGIIPRAIEQVFSENSEHLSHKPSIKVEKNRFTLLSDDDMLKELNYLKKIKASMSLSHQEFRHGQELIRKSHKFHAKESDSQAFIWISMVEIYNELTYDLLSSDAFCSKRRNLKILSNDGNPYVSDLTSVFAATSEDAYDILQYGLRGASYGATDVNSNSSRSHTIFMMTIIDYEPATQNASYAAYKFCDLAGSERLKKTGTVGDRLKEAQKINTSLLVLGKCLDTIHKNQRSKKLNDLIPVRESKLTMLLQSALCGREKLTMIVNLYPNEKYYEENLNVLNFSSIAKQIHIKKAPRVKINATRYSLLLANVPSSPSCMSGIQSTLKAEIQELQHEVEQLKKTVNQMQDDDICRLNELVSQKDEEIYELRREIAMQEVALRNELTDGFEEILKKREEMMVTRSEQIVESNINIYRVKLEHREERLAQYRELINKFESNEAQMEAEIEGLQSQLEIYKKKEEGKTKKRRLSLF